MGRGPYGGEQVPRDASRSPDDCPSCGRYVEWVARRNVTHPTRGLVREPFKYMPCGHLVSNGDVSPDHVSNPDGETIRAIDDPATLAETARIMRNALARKRASKDEQEL